MSDITPGPWIVAPASGSGLPDSQKKYNGKPYQEHSLVTAGERCCHKGVAHIYQGYGEVGSPDALSEQLANARLIAAAPDLLEEAEEAEKTLVVLLGNIHAECKRDSAAAIWWDGVPEVIQKRINALRSAIAKARGKEAE